MLYFILWVVLSFIIASYGKSRKIGFLLALIVSLILSPLVGAIVVLLSEKSSETMMKLKISRDANLISEEEYQKELKKLVPNQQDQADANRGYLAIAAIIILFIIVIRCVN
jgi:predicted PurR-regulated permease PerM